MTSIFMRKNNSFLIKIKPINSRLISANCKLFSPSNAEKNKKEEKNVLFEHLKSKILLTGPITIASYMKEILTHPKHGYYINKDVFGTAGDFTTSPEITQIFGELVAIWIINEMNKINAPTNKINLLELGPGRGTMMRDVLRTFKKLKISDQINEVSLVEVSNELCKIQASYLCVKNSFSQNEDTLNTTKNENVDDSVDKAERDKVYEEFVKSVEINRQKSIEKMLKGDKIDFIKNARTYLMKEMKVFSNKIEHNEVEYDDIKSSTDLSYQNGVTENGINVKWYKSILDVPQNYFTLIFAHEFFDALPIHKFIRTDVGWREVLIDFDIEKNEFIYVQAKNTTPACLYIDQKETRDHIEVSPETGVIVQNIAKRLEENGGIALIIDYGHTGNGTDTFRAYHQHSQTHPLKNVGISDLTADVDFKYIQDQVKDKLITFGPITQGEFLTRMHIDVRLNALLQVCSNDHERSILESAVNMIVHEEQMGARFKFLSLFPSVLKLFYKKRPVYAFTEGKHL